LKSSITKQILTVLLFILILFLGYISFGHSFTKDTKSNINNIKTNNVPTLLLDIDNLKLIREVTMLFSDIAITGENILIFFHYILYFELINYFDLIIH
jgi:amino acid permease